MPTKSKPVKRRPTTAARTAPRRPSARRTIANFQLKDDATGRMILTELRRDGGRFYGAGAAVRREGHGNYSAIVSVSSISTHGKVDTYKEEGYGRSAEEAIDVALYSLWQNIS